MLRRATNVVKGFRTQDGAGVSLVRVLGDQTMDAFDPFLMLDSFDSSNPDDYTAGFPFHPHRGIETISYLREGSMHHRDSLGFEDTVSDGGIQWMCAGSGIMHEEAIPAAKRLLGVQLWLNMPAREKMSSPRYHAVRSRDIEEIALGGGATLRLLAGHYGEHSGYQGQHLPLDYYDIGMPPHGDVAIDVNEDNAVMAFTLLGSARIGGLPLGPKTAARLEQGDQVRIQTQGERAQVLLMSSKRLDEPVAWGGPIVMNSNEELMRAFRELEDGSFLKERSASD